MAKSEIDQTVLVLGGSGYVGSHFRSKFPGNNFIFLKHQDEKSLQYQVYTKVNIVLNLSSSKLSASPQESRTANFDYPNRILKRVIDHPVKWIQVASYYELQVPKGRNDHYSLDKLNFRIFLEELATQNQNLNVTSLIFPHIFGGSENKSRIIPTLTKMNNGEKVILGGQNQLLPILHISDAVRALSQAITTEQIYCTPRPMWHGRLEELVLKLAKSRADYDRAHFHNTLQKYQESELEYPELLTNFSPELVFEQFIKIFKNGDLR
jgi:nucleoside-diphosphate-sugar epimerase